MLDGQTKRSILSTQRRSDKTDTVTWTDTTKYSELSKTSRGQIQSRGQTRPVRGQIKRSIPSSQEVQKTDTVTRTDTISAWTDKTKYSELSRGPEDIYSHMDRHDGRTDKTK